MNIPSISISNGEKMPAMIVGTFQHKSYQTLKNIISAGIDNGFTGFDTAPSYGNQSELGKVIQECTHERSLKREDVYIIDKIDAWQMHQSYGNVKKYIDNALTKLKTDYLDLLLIHWPIPGYLEATWNTFIESYKTGKVKAIGICNVNERHISQLIEQTGFTPHVVQIERHPLRTDQNTILFNQKHKITTQAYSPVCRMIAPLKNSSVLDNIAKKHEKSIGQIIMRWHFETGSVPVFMTSKIDRIKEYAEVFNFKLKKTEIEEISNLNCNYKFFLESIGCPGF